LNNPVKNLQLKIQEDVMPSKRNTILLVLLVSQLFIYCHADNVSALHSGSSIKFSDTNTHPADVSSIDAIITAIYDSITFPKGKEPNLDRFRSLFTSNAQFIRMTEEGVKIMHLDGFISSFADRVKKGELTSFYEKEVSRKESTFGNIAHIFSKYVKCVNQDTPAAERSGVNSIQLFYEGKRWWICCILWEDTPTDNTK
jgi:hypothetical protein